MNGQFQSLPEILPKWPSNVFNRNFHDQYVAARRLGAMTQFTKVQKPGIVSATKRHDST